MPAGHVAIIGAIDKDPDEADVIARLAERSDGVVDWSWVKATCAGCRPADGALRAFWRRISEWKAAEANYLKSGGDQPNSLTVVKLPMLHGQVQSALFKHWPDPVTVPKHITPLSELVEWLLSADANLVPRRWWDLNVEEAALISILCKLLKNRSFNKDTQGHAWTKEADLLGQFPVDRTDLPAIRKCAIPHLSRFEGSLLIQKGGNQGKTPKEWCIHTQYLPAVKRTILDMSFAALLEQPALRSMIESVQTDQDRSVRLGDDVIKERVRAVCTERSRTAND